MSNDCMEFMHFQPHAQMPHDDTTSDYRYNLLHMISVYNAGLCKQNQRLQ